MQPTQNPTQPYQTYESYLNQGRPFLDIDKSFTDKLLGRQDANKLTELIRKDELEREDLSEILNLISSINSKLVNYNEWDRYSLGKYYTWIRSFIKEAQEVIKLKKEVEVFIVATKKEIDETKDSEKLIKLNAMMDTHMLTSDLITKTRDFICDDSKFIIDVFLFMSNSTLSLGAAAFDTLSTSRYEYSYPIVNPPTVTPDNQSKGILSIFKRK